MINRTLLKYRNMTIRNKIIAIYLPLIIIPLFFVVYSSNYIFTRSIIARTKQSIIDESDLITMRINGIYANAETCANMLTKDINNIFIYNDINNMNQISFVTIKNQIISALDYDTRAFKEIDSSAFIDINANIITSHTGLITCENNVLDYALLRTINQPGPPINIWFPMQIRGYLVLDIRFPILSLGKRIVNINTGRTMGFIILNIKENTISSIFPKFDSTSKKMYFILDKYGRVVSSINKMELLKTVKTRALARMALDGNTSTNQLQIDKKPYLITSSAIEKLDWRLINQVPVRELTQNIYINSIVITIVGLLCITIGLLGAFFLARLIANPLAKLTRIAKEVKDGNLNVSYVSGSSDEVGILASVFNEMVVKVKELLEKVKSEQKKKREYELALIQSQIKPHFLYNSLDLIYVMCETGIGSEAAETTKALADFYRAALSKGKEIISIREELKNTTDYLFIQRTRYSDVLDFEVEVDEGIMQCNILKMTLQPLVENSIYHGIQPKCLPGRIRIHGYQDGESIVLKVHDDGVGIPAGKMHGIMDHSLPESPKDSFGLISVHERIKLYFGDDYGLQIISEPGSGTEVTVTIPKTNGGL